MPEPSLALLQTLLERLLEQQRQVVDVLERVERRALMLLVHVGCSEWNGGY